jgi:hypothetical protein
MAVEMELESQKKKKTVSGEPANEEEDAVYKDVKWKDFITKKKYIRQHPPLSPLSGFR